MAMYRTPIIANPRKDGSTMYTFSSALEDIGLNINERNNKVRLSHYVLLDLPSIVFEDNAQAGTFNVNNFFPDTADAEYATFKSKLKSETEESEGNKSNGWFSVAMNNYMMNMETVLRNQGTYDHSVAKTVTERCFWKFLQKSGAINFNVAVDDDELYFHENWSDQDAIDSTVIKGYGAITSSSQSSNDYSVNNETYIMVPSSYGQMKYVLKRVNDNNYIAGEEYIGTTKERKLEGHTEGADENPYVFALADSVGRSLTEGADTYNISYETEKTSTMIPDLEFVFSNNEIRNQLFKDDTRATVSYDNIAIDTDKVLSSKYKFNAVLVYYSIFDSNGNISATNLFGIMLVNGQEKVDGENEYKIEELTKIQSTTGAFGSSYFFRINMQTASIYDATDNTIVDYSTAEASTLTDFNDVVSALNTTINILKQNAQVLNNQYLANQAIKDVATQAITKVNELEQNINSILSGVNDETLIEVYPYVYRGQNAPTDHHLYIGVKSNIDLSANGIGLCYAKLSTVKPSHRQYRKRAWHSIPRLPFNNGTPEPLIVPILKSKTPSFVKNGINYYEISVDGCETFCEFINKTYNEFETGYKNYDEHDNPVSINVGALMKKGTNGICITKDGTAISDFIRFKVRYATIGSGTNKHYTITF